MYFTKAILSTIFLFSIVLLSAQEYHVAKNGDDGNAGSAASPWESIQHAMDHAVAGSTAYIHAGVYKEALYVNVSSSEGKYITFTNFNEEEVIIDAQGQTSTAVIEL